MNLSAAAARALAEFQAASGWEARARLLLQWGERLAPLSETERIPDNQIRGCDSQVWLVAERREDGWHFRATSEARLVRGLLALLLVRVEGLDADAIGALDLNDWFAQLGLSRQLSPSRSNGLNAVLQRLRELITP